MADIQTVRSVRAAAYGRLVEQGLITREGLRAAAERAVKDGADLETLLAADHSIPASELGRALSAFHQAPFAPFDPALKLDPELIRRANPQYFRRVLAVPLRDDGAVVDVLCRNPRDPQLCADFQLLFPERRPRLLVGLVKDIERYIEALDRAAHPAAEPAPVEEAVVETPPGLEEVDERDGVVVKLAQQLLVDAWQAGASDIHFEPYADKDAVVRFRVSGECAIHARVPRRCARALVSRFKLMAQLDISERRRPQDGKLSVRASGKRLDFRVATIPTAGGLEDVVLRVLPTGEPIPLENLSFAERNLRDVRHALQQPYGVFLCVGPTGSGKTTTLHACLFFLNGPDIKIWTAEDPVEITQFGLRQVQVNSKIGFTFAGALRSFLRADPDVIMVGEMRDKETAEIAIEASLTGHLVLSTLHTNSALETNVRLLDMGLDPFNYSDSLVGILAQRLVRRLCKACRIPSRASDQQLSELSRHYGAAEFERDRPAGELLLYKPGSCERCGGSGYSGRVGVHELFLPTDETRRMIQRRAPALEVLAAAKAAGMRTLLQDGILKCLAGETDYAQVRAAVR